MRRFLCCLFLVLGTLAFALPANALLMGVSGPLSSLGFPASIIAAPPDVRDDAAFNSAQQGFNEAQGVLLTAALAVDGGTIPSGTVVDSHMIFLNTGPGNSTQRASHFDVNWTFDGEILGVMSDSMGNLEVASSPLLGASGTIYPAAPFTARGLESNTGPSSPNDGYSYGTNSLTIGVGMTVTEPGDWIRVVTSAQVPEPATMLLIGTGLVGLVGLRRKFKA